VTTEPALAQHDVAWIRAENPGPMTLSGTNTWVLSREPCYVVDPGPRLDDHLDAIVAEGERRGGIAGIALTHGHADHKDAVEALRGLTAAPPAATGGELGPLHAVPTPGHSHDHVAWLLERVCCTGDAVLGEGSVFVSGMLAEYLEALRVLRTLDLALLLPGHGPPVTDPAAKLDEYIAHRLDRERRLLEALDRGKRSVDELLDDAWSDAPQAMRLPATVTLAAHLDKLDAEGILPQGVERPEVPRYFSV
jgi:glyoxylase-like metal-dependent hydrolase (beta-lactamase superfamily II)